MPARKKDVCKNGHLRTPENLYPSRSCKLCMNKRQTLLRQAKPEFSLWRAAKDRASKAGIEFTIEPTDVEIPERCPVLGIMLKQSPDKRADSSPSLDRIDNSKGYVKGNICVISWRANKLKGDGTFSEHLKIIRWMAKQKGY